VRQRERSSFGWPIWGGKELGVCHWQEVIASRGYNSGLLGGMCRSTFCV